MDHGIIDDVDDYDVDEEYVEDDGIISIPDIQRTCTDIVVYEETPDFVRVWFSGECKVTPWQLVLYVAWLSVSFLIRMNGEFDTTLKEKKLYLQSELQEEQNDQRRRLQLMPSHEVLDNMPSVDVDSYDDYESCLFVDAH